MLNVPHETKEEKTKEQKGGRREESGRKRGEGGME